MSAEKRTVRFNAQGMVTVRQAPTQLLMKMPLQAAGATLELSLTALRKQAVVAERWLRSLGAATILSGEPHFADSGSQDPVRKARELTARAMGRPRSAQDASRTKKVAMVLTALWDIAGRSAEERLVMLDRLQFEAASDHSSEEKEAGPDLESITDPMQMQAMLAEMMTPKEDPRQAHFLFITRLSEESAREAYQQAYDQAIRQVEGLAGLAGCSAGRLESATYGHGADYTSAVHRHMEMQACQTILAGSGYQPGEHEIVSEQSTTAEFRLSVAVHFVGEG